MRLTIIGSGTAIPQKNRSAPCCLIEHEDERIVVDIGPGSARGILVHGGVTLNEIGLILITHFHLDHCGDLAPALFALRSPELARSQALEIVGPNGLKNHFNGLRALWGHRVDPLNYDLVVREWPGEEFKWGSFYISAAGTKHSEPNMAWRVRIPGGGAVIVTGDGEPTGELAALGCSVSHTMVAEASLPVGQEAEGHMNPGQAGDLARRCGSEKLVLTHLNPGVRPGPAEDEARKRFDGEVIVAEDGMVIEID